MAAFFRSISIKIFGVSLGLLVIMAAAALWSANLTGEVHLQLRTLSHSLFPMTLTVARLDRDALDQEIHADTEGELPDMAAVEQCRAAATARAADTENVLRRAQDLRAHGVDFAVLERNRIMFARLEPMLAELQYQENRLYRMTMATCTVDARAATLQRARDQAREVGRLAQNITREIDGFVTKGAVLVGENQQIAMHANLLMIGTAAMVGLMLAWLVSRGLTRPIIRLQAGARAVSAGMLDEAQVPVTSSDEIGDVTRAFNAMVVDLHEKERIKEAFGQYVDPRIVAGLIGGGSYLTDGEKQVATLYFSDVIGFTGIAERLAPSTLVDLINAYFSEMSVPIRESSGIIDKYIGDAIMAFWVPPFVDAHAQARLACEAALGQFARLDAFRAQVPDLIGLRRDIPLIDFRVGLATGEVVVGSVGSSQARSFTVMGDTVNYASRLESANKVFGTRLLIDGATRDAAGDAIEARLLDRIVVMGRTQAIRIYELRAMAGSLSAADCSLFDLFAEALSHYDLGEWDRASEAFHAVLASHPGDGPSQTLLQRIEQLRLAPPADWDGTWRMTSK